MENLNKYEIGIVDTRKVVQTIWDNYAFDLKDFALTSLKRRIEHTISVFNLTDAEGLINRLRKEKVFFEEFVKEFMVETTELFRDPSLWRMLRDNIIPGLLNSNGTTKFFVPMVTSGEELYSLAILLRESGFDRSSQVIASSFTDKNIEQVSKGVFNLKNFENSESNYQKFAGKPDVKKYLTLSGNSGFWEKSLIENVKFIRQNTSFDEIPGGLRLIIFRNKLIYFNQTLADRALSALYQSLLPGGYLVIGTKEIIASNNSGYNFQLVDQNEKIYRKK